MVRSAWQPGAYRSASRLGGRVIREDEDDLVILAGEATDGAMLRGYHLGRWLGPQRLLETEHGRADSRGEACAEGRLLESLDTRCLIGVSQLRRRSPRVTQRGRPDGPRSQS